LLREYLAAPRDNNVVVTDYTELEMLKAETVGGILKSTSISKSSAARKAHTGREQSARQEEGTAHP
jgi:hypothetical protein